MTDEKDGSETIIEVATELNRIATDTLNKLQQIQDLQITGTRAEAVFSEVKDGIIIINKENEIIITNAKADEMFGYDDNELLGKPLIVLIPEKYRPAHLAKQESYFANPSPRLFRSLEGLHKDGLLFLVEIALQPLGSISANPLIMAILRKIKETSANVPGPTIWLG